MIYQFYLIKQKIKGILKFHPRLVIPPPKNWSIYFEVIDIVIIELSNYLENKVNQ